METPSLEYLQAVASNVEERNVPVPLTPDEMNERRAALAQRAIEQDDADEAFKSVKADYMATTKIRRGEQQQLVKTLRRGYEDRMVTCYDVPDQEAGTMTTYAADGTVLQVRRLRPDERQARVFTAMSEAANG